MLHKSTIQLLRFPFSFFLMPVYWFALSFLGNFEPSRAILIFVVLHVLMYPASNGYNSYMDRDEASIGGVENPLPPTKQLFFLSIWMELIAVVTSFSMGIFIGALALLYIIFSRLYSYRAIRLKRFAIIGFLTVVLNQGATVFLMVYAAASTQPLVTIPWLGMLISTLLIGGFYPITQIYQHEQDAKDGVQTMSMLLGIRGTFIGCALLYLLAFALLFSYYLSINSLATFFLIQVLFVPVIIYFLYWFYQVWQNAELANFKYTMRMNWIASIFTNIAFVTICLLHYFK